MVAGVVHIESNSLSAKAFVVMIGLRFVLGTSLVSFYQLCFFRYILSSQRGTMLYFMLFEFLPFVVYSYRVFTRIDLSYVRLSHAQAMGGALK